MRETKLNHDFKFIKNATHKMTGLKFDGKLILAKILLF